MTPINDQMNVDVEEYMEEVVAEPTELLSLSERTFNVNKKINKRKTGEALEDKERKPKKKKVLSIVLIYYIHSFIGGCHC